MLLSYNGGMPKLTVEGYGMFEVPEGKRLVNASCPKNLNGQEFPVEGVAFYREPPALVVGETMFSPTKGSDGLFESPHAQYRTCETVVVRKESIQC